MGSTIARETDAGVYLHAGPEIGVASTKAFTAQILVLSMMALHLARERATLKEAEIKEKIAQLYAIPKQVEVVLRQKCAPSIPPKPAYLHTTVTLLSYRPIPAAATRFGRRAASTSWPATFFIWAAASTSRSRSRARSRTRRLATSRPRYERAGPQQCAAELVDPSAPTHPRTHLAQGYPAAEMKHGPIALIDPFMPVVFIAPSTDATYEKIKSNVEEVLARDGSIILITDEVRSLRPLPSGAGSRHADRTHPHGTGQPRNGQQV